MTSATPLALLENFRVPRVRSMAALAAVPSVGGALAPSARLSMKRWGLAYANAKWAARIQPRIIVTIPSRIWLSPPAKSLKLFRKSLRCAFAAEPLAVCLFLI
jgi:hypothetical protein